MIIGLELIGKRVKPRLPRGRMNYLAGLCAIAILAQLVLKNFFPWLFGG